MAKGGYVIALKGNQGTLQEDLKNHEMTNENNDKGHGRLEQRVAAIANDIAWVEWPGQSYWTNHSDSMEKRKGNERNPLLYLFFSIRCRF